MSDWRIEALAEIEDMRRRLFELKHLIATSMKHDEFVQKIVNLTRESDEAAANFGQDCAALRPIAKGMECSTHAFAAIQCSGGVCSEAMDDLEDVK